MGFIVFRNLRQPDEGYQAIEFLPFSQRSALFEKNVEFLVVVWKNQITFVV